MVYLRNYCQTQCHEAFMLSAKFDSFSSYTQVVVCSELLFVCGVMVRLHLLHVDVQLPQHPLFKDSLFPVELS